MRRLTLSFLSGAALVAALTLSACTSAPVPVAPRPVVAAPPPPDTPQSAAMRAYFAQQQETLLSRGLLRTDGGSPDVPFTDRTLAEAFLRVALYDEFGSADEGSVAQETASRLRRWQAPIRVSLRFGDSVPEDRRATERVRVGGYLERLAQITGHPIRLSEAAPNFFVYVVSEDERQALAPQIAAVMPDLSASEISAFTRMPLSTYCQISVSAAARSSVYVRAFAVIRSEHPDLLNLSCINEEIAQGLGLPNDSPRARPSIFNDDQEFALLTPMDELMLRMLYDDRLRPGMTEDEVRPLVGLIAAELLGGGV